MAESPAVRGAPIGVLGAMESEIRGLVGAMQVRTTGHTAGFEYWTGDLAGREVVVARCGMGKVAAAAGVQRLIDEWRVSCLVVCGLAGALSADLRLGDIVVGDTFVQHDLDASPIFPRFEVPGLGVTLFHADDALATAAEVAANGVARLLSEESAARSNLPVGGQRVYRGLIATGDQFIRDEKRDEILTHFPHALCVEMEGGAIAQVCTLNRTPFVIVRIISDAADEAAPIDFLRFVEELAPLYTVSIVKALLPRLP